jgi:hypothetical protein
MRYLKRYNYWIHRADDRDIILLARINWPMPLEGWTEKIRSRQSNSMHASNWTSLMRRWSHSSPSGSPWCDEEAYSINEWKSGIHCVQLTRETGRAVALGRVFVMTWPNLNDLSLGDDDLILHSVIYIEFTCMQTNATLFTNSPFFRGRHHYWTHVWQTR